jgi:hypothetical protein
MTWIDSILTSSAIVWIILILFAINLYLRKTGKTFPEMIKGIIEFFNGITEEKKI